MVSVGFSGKSFSSNGAEKTGPFSALHCRSLLGFSICLHLFTQGLGAPSFSSLERIFRETSVQYHRQTEMLRRKQQPVIVGIALSSSAASADFGLSAITLRSVGHDEIMALEFGHFESVAQGGLKSIDQG